MSLEHFLLGILLDCPAHGYKIKKMIAPFVSRENTLNDALLYPKLKKLEKAGQLSKQVIQQEGVPGKNHYSVTPDGQTAFLDWLESDADEDDAITYDFFRKNVFLSKYMFFKKLKPTDRVEKLERQCRTTQDRIAEFKEILAGMKDRRVDPYRVRIMDYGLNYQNMKLAWLNDMLDLERKAGRGKKQNPSRSASR